MSIPEQRKEDVRATVRSITEPESDERERLLEAVDDLPIKRPETIQSDSGQVLGTRFFERDLADEFAEVGNSMAPLSSWLALHLDDVGEDYVYRMHKRFRWFTAVQIPAYHPGNYNSFRTHLWKLHELGLVEETKSELSPVDGRKDRQYYAVVDDRVESDAWQNPSEALYGESMPVHIREIIDEEIRAAGGEPDLQDVAAHLDMGPGSLYLKFDDWQFDLEERVDKVLDGSANRG